MYWLLPLKQLLCSSHKWFLKLELFTLNKSHLSMGIGLLPSESFLSSHCFQNDIWTSKSDFHGSLWLAPWLPCALAAPVTQHRLLVIAQYFPFSHSCVYLEHLSLSPSLANTYSSVEENLFLPRPAHCLPLAFKVALYVALGTCGIWPDVLQVLTLLLPPAWSSWGQGDVLLCMPKHRAQDNVC